ncbi:MAG: DUF4149 domain-containing protein [Nitrospinaceae bacterium]|nr:DUF4149 domain-containing protein [Nitrospinaceae bacterium]NIR56309.1 DUF4149 domain-containing protein [Nitrospinaceae bacterium]NIS86766.1 DUF4149 domain-containing protein [Nitrospinaceae bacterium]NIT83601.1 DUF4149 domain-containing protein [Nitrospinaceae bacterium]NIU45803.1 DUF4149 domain-containing protein [Nitrospinaceae bacterium]
MKRLIYFANWLYLFSLALWVGGMFLLGILVESVVRRKVEQPLKSEVMNRIMDVFNTSIIFWCLGLMIFAVALKFLAESKGWAGYVENVVTKKRYTKQVLFAVMVAVALYIGGILSPQMHAVDKQKQANPEDVRLQVQFDRYHMRVELLYTVNMILGLILFYIHGKEMTRFKEGPGGSG